MSDLKNKMKEYFTLRAEREDVRQQDRDMTKDIVKLEEEILTELESLGLDTTAIKGLGTVTMNDEDVATISDRETFMHWLKSEEGLMETVILRTNSAAFRELWELGIEIPGIKKYTRKKLSVRKN